MRALAHHRAYVQAMKGESILISILLKSMMIVMVMIVMVMIILIPPRQVSAPADRASRPHRTGPGRVQLRQDTQQADQQGGAGGPAQEDGHGEGR